MVALRLDEESWSLDIRDVEVFDPITRHWSHETDADTYGGEIRSEHTVQRCPKTGLITLNGYASVVWIAPPERSWSSVDWPEGDVYPGGPMAG